MMNVIFDGFVKSRHSRAGGNPECINIWKRLDSRFHGNDGKIKLRTFYKITILEFRGIGELKDSRIVGGEMKGCK